MMRRTGKKSSFGISKPSGIAVLALAAGALLCAACGNDSSVQKSFLDSDSSHRDTASFDSGGGDADTSTAFDTDSYTPDDSDTPNDSDTALHKDTDADSDGHLDPAQDCAQPPVTQSCKDGWCTVPAGCFIFGSPDKEGNTCRSKYSETEVQVTLTRDFEIHQTPLTQEEWGKAGLPLPNPLGKFSCPSCPVTWITIYEAMAYCNVLSRQAGLSECYDLSSCTGTLGGGCPDDRLYFCDHNNTDVYICTDQVQRYPDDPYACDGYRLPTTAEWEYAARAGTRTATYAGDLEDDIKEACEPNAVLDSIAWHCGNVNGGANIQGNADDQYYIPVGQKQPNAFGLYDMLGGDEEFCASTFVNKALEQLVGKKGPLTDPAPPLELFDKYMRVVVRGAGYAQAPCFCRSAFAYGGAQAPLRWETSGFRPVRTLNADGTK